MEGGDGGDWPKASIGNYKGVMLCNRPTEVNGPKKADRTGPNVPFNSRVIHDEPVGWNPTKKLVPRDVKRKKKIDPNNALLKHKRFLKSLEEQKQRERDERIISEFEKEEKVNKFKDQAEKQRQKIKDLKTNGGDAVGNEENGSPARSGPEDDDHEKEQPYVPAKLTKENLDKQSEAASKKAASKPASKASKAKPAWALTEKDVEEQKEKEIDELLEFAYELDYEKYMDDFEVRQALAIIKDRVQEIKKDSDWKNKMADEWNQAAGGQETVNAGPQDKLETRSVVSYHSSKTAASKKSLRSQVLEAIQEEG